MSRSVSLLEHEIRSQPTILARRAPSSIEQARLIVGQLQARGTDHLVIAARGSSDNAARFGQYLLTSRVRLVASLAAPSLFASTYSAPRLGQAAVIAVSQSGRSPDIVSVLAAARDQQRPALAITNELDSPLASTADLVLPIGAGPEAAVAATKTYLLSLVAFVELADAWDPDGSSPWRGSLPNLVERVIDQAFAANACIDVLAGAPSLTVVGRGLGYSAAMEASLKLREVTGILAEAWSPPDLLHGPIAGLRGQSAVLLITTPDFPSEYWQDVAGRLADRSSVLLVISDDEQTRGLGHAGIEIPSTPAAWMTSALAAVAAQVLALCVGHARGLDVDSPAGLTKVTLTS